MADEQVSDQTAYTTPVAADIVPVQKNADGVLYKVALSNFWTYGLAYINSLTADASPDETADYLATFDASASLPKKVLPNVLITDAKIATSDITTNNASTSKHGWLPKIPNTYLQVLSPKTGAWVQKVVYKTANETVNNNGTPQADDELLWPVLANEIWQFDMTLYYTGVNTTADILYGWTVPASTTMLWGAGAAGTVTDSSFMNVPVANTPGLMLSESGTQTAATNNGTVGVKISGLVTVSSTAGNVVFRWSQNTAGATNLIVLKGSNIILTQLA